MTCPVHVPLTHRWSPPNFDVLSPIDAARGAVTPGTSAVDAR